MISEKYRIENKKSGKKIWSLGKCPYLCNRNKEINNNTSKVADKNWDMV